jgi:hypothetical protein
MEQLDADSKAQLHAAEYVDEAAIAPLTPTINLNELAAADFRAKVQLGALDSSEYEENHPEQEALLDAFEELEYPQKTAELATELVRRGKLQSGACD